MQGPSESVREMIDDPDTKAVSVVAQSVDDAFVASEIGNYELEYQDVVDLAAYHLISLEMEVDGNAKDILRDVIHRRNELKNRDTINPSETTNQFIRPEDGV